MDEKEMLEEHAARVAFSETLDGLQKTKPFLFQSVELEGRREPVVALRFYITKVNGVRTIKPMSSAR